MLKVNGKDVIFSKSFLMAQNDEVRLKVPEIIGRDIKIEMNGTVTQHVGTSNAFDSDESDMHLTILKIPFADEGGFSVNFIQGGQLATRKGPVECRVSGQAIGGKMMLVHLDLHEGRYDNYVGD